MCIRDRSESDYPKKGCIFEEERTHIGLSGSNDQELVCNSVDLDFTPFDAVLCLCNRDEACFEKIFDMVFCSCQRNGKPGGNLGQALFVIGKQLEDITGSLACHCLGNFLGPFIAGLEDYDVVSHASPQLSFRVRLSEQDQSG